MKVVPRFFYTGTVVEVNYLICLLLAGMMPVPLLAVSMTQSAGISLQDSIPKKKAKPYVAWIDVARPDSVWGVPQWVGRYKGKLRGVTDSSLIFETKKPFPDWKKAGDYYEVPYSDVQTIAFRRRYSPFLWIGIAYLAGPLVGAVVGVSITKANTGGQEDLARDLNGLIGATIGGMAGLLFCLIVFLKKTKFQLQRDKSAFARFRATLQQYVQ